MVWGGAVGTLVVIMFISLFFYRTYSKERVLRKADQAKALVERAGFENQVFTMQHEVTDHIKHQRELEEELKVVLTYKKYEVELLQVSETISPRARRTLLTRFLCAGRDQHLPEGARRRAIEAAHRG